LIPNLKYCAGRESPVIIETFQLHFGLDRIGSFFNLSDGRSVSTPLVWYPRLLNATVKEEKFVDWENTKRQLRATHS